MGRIWGVLIVAAIVLGLKFYNKHSDKSEVRGKMVQLCEGEAACVKAVETHFEACFEAAYKMGGRRSASRLEAEQFVQCVNSRSGKPYFALNKP